MTTNTETPLRVLIVDDTATDAELMQRALTRAELAHIAKRVDTEPEFVAELEAFAPDIVLLDYKLPDYDGRRALDHVRRVHPEIPVVMVTGTLGDEGAIELLKSGAKDYVLKDNLARLPAAVSGAIAIEQGIRARKSAEHALRDSEQRFRAVSEAAQDAIVMIDAAGAIVLWNPAAERMFGYSAAEAIGRSVHQLITPPRFRPAADAGMEGFRATGTGAMIGKTVELVALRRDGVELPVELSLAAARTAGEWRAVGVIRDISERKAAEHALRTSEAQLSDALQMARAGHWTYDVPADRFTFNDNFYRIFHTTAAEVGGYVLSAAEYARRFCHPDDIGVVAREVGAAITTTDPDFTREIEHRILYADGTTGWITVRFFIEKDSGGRTIRTYGVNQDITERKLTEERIREEEAKFRGLVEQNVAGIVIVRDDGTPAYVNPYLLALGGYSFAEMRDRTVLDFVPEEEKPVVAEKLCAQFGDAAGLMQITTAMLAKDGSRIDIIINASPITYEGRPAALGVVLDITERRRTEARLQATQERYRQLFEHSRDAVLSLAPPHWHFTSANRAALEMFGVGSADEFARLGPWRVSPERQPDGTPSSELTRTMIERAMHDGSHLFEWEHRRTNGECFPAEVLLTRVDVEDETFLYATARDITERKRAEQALKESEQRFRDVVESSGDWVWEIGPDDRFSYASPRVRELLGYQPAEVIGRKYYELMPEETARQVDPIFQQLKAERKPFRSLENTMLHWDGREIVVETSAVPIVRADGAFACYRGIDHNIDERIRAAAKLREEEAKFRGLVEQQIAGIYITRMDGTIAYVNPQMAMMTGYTEEELVGRSFLAFIAEADRERVAGITAEQAAGGRGATQEQLTIKRKDGRTIEVLVHDSVAQYQGQPAFIGVALDVTERNRAERERAFNAVVLATEQEVSPDAILVVEGTGKIISVNRRFGDMFQIPAELLAAQDDEPVLITATSRMADPEAFLQRVRYLYAHPDEESRDELLLKDGRVVERHTAPMRAPGGDYLGRVWFFRDISDRVQAARELAESERKLRAIIDAAGEGITVTDANTHTVAMANRALCQMLGYTAAELIGTHVSALHPAGEMPKVETHFQRIAAGESHATAEFEVTRRDGSIFPATITASPLSLDGRPYAIAIFADITERKRTEQKIRSDAERMGRQIEAIRKIGETEGIMAGDVEGIAREITETASATLDCERVNVWLFEKEETELRCIDLYEAGPAKHSAGAILSETEYGPEMRIVKQSKFVDADKPLTDPRVAGYIDSYIKPLGITSMLDVLIDASGNNFGLICFEHVGKAHHWERYEIEFALKMADQIGLTIMSAKRLEIETALHQSRELLQGVMNAIPVAVFWKDRNLNYLGCNTLFARDAGYSAPEELIGKDDYQMGWREMADGYRADDRQVIDSGRPKLLIEEPLRKGSGELITLLTSKIPLRSAAGEIDGVLGTYTDISERKKSEQALIRLNRSLRTLSAGNEVLVHVDSEETLYRETCRVAVEVGGFHVAWIGVPIEQAGEKIIKPVAWAGIDETAFADLPSLGWGDGPRASSICGRAVTTGEPQVSQNLGAEPWMEPWRDRVESLKVKSAAAFPLKDARGVFAVLTINSAETDTFDADEVTLLQELATDLAFGVQAARDRVERASINQRWRASLEATVGAIARAVEARDPYTAGHEQRVARLAVAIAERLGLSEHDVHGLYLAGVIHDVGKITIPAEILNKPGQLTRIEFDLIKVHAQSGYEIIQGVDFPWPIAQMIQQHHERIDGSGYPQGLKGDAILRQARILAVADVTEAMMSHRPYRPALGLPAALAEIEAQAGKQLDPEAVTACLCLFRDRGFTF